METKLIDPTQPIGVFDSGVGGLTVLKELATHFPSENFIYLGDTARLPYGTKSSQTIHNYSLQNIQFLLKRQVKAVVIACNSASSHFKLHELDGIPIYNVIEPGAQAAIKKTHNHRIGVLGTKATVSSQSYVQTIHSFSEEAQVFQQACPLLVPLAEEGWIDDPITNLIVYRYIHPLTEKNIDTLILGCTHYPILKKAIQKAAGNSIELVDSGVAMAHTLEQELKLKRWELNPQSPDQRIIELMATDALESFLKMAHEILFPIKVHFSELVDVRS